MGGVWYRRETYTEGGGPAWLILRFGVATAEMVNNREVMEHQGGTI